MHPLTPHRRGRTTVALAVLGLVGALLMSAGCGMAPRPRPEPPSPAPGHERIFSVTPSSAAEQQRLGTDFPVADAQPTGLYLPPGPSLTVLTGHAAGAPVPVLLVGTYGLDQDDKSPERMPRECPLKPGSTTVKDPRGGMLYVRYTSDDSTVGSGDVTVRFGEAARPVPRTGQHPPVGSGAPGSPRPGTRRWHSSSASMSS